MYIIDYGKWSRNFPLNDFKKIVYPIDEKNPRIKDHRLLHTKKLMVLVDIINFNRYFIFNPLRRIDDYLPNIVKKDLSPYSFEEQFEKGAQLDFLITEIITLYINFRIYADKIARFLHAFSINGFSDYRYQPWFEKSNEIPDDYKGLRKIIEESGVWYVDLRDIRTNFIVHYGLTQGSIDIQPEIAVNLMSFKNYKLKKISLRDILNLENALYKFTKYINDYFCENIENLPLKMPARVRVRSQ